MPKIMIVAGEASGDVHGANLAKEIKSIHPEAELVGMGGKQMAAAGVQLLFDPTGISTIGFTEVLRHYRRLKGVLRHLAAYVAEKRPDVVVLVDYPGFNLRLAALVKQVGIPVLYFISPAVWAWGSHRVKQVAASVTKLCVIFPFEEDIYRAAGCDVTFVGHPLLDLMPKEKRPTSLRDELGFSSAEQVVALLPGSRPQEIRNLLAPMLAAGRHILSVQPTAKFIVSVAHTLSKDTIEAELAKVPDMAPAIRLVEGRTHEILQAASVAVVACGTATLEAALIGTPLVALYRLAPLTAVIAKRLIRTPHVALPNIVAGRRIVPELVQQDVNPKRIAQEALRLMLDVDQQRAVRADLAEVARRLGEPGAAGRVARLVLELVG